MPDVASQTRERIFWSEAYPMISVLVVDDSTFMRNTITALLEQDSDIKIVGTARNVSEALQKAEELDPDVMTLDVDLPRLDGLGALQQLMKKRRFRCLWSARSPRAVQKAR